jgi:hypothetical protein
MVNAEYRPQIGDYATDERARGFAFLLVPEQHAEAWRALVLEVGLRAPPSPRSVRALSSRPCVICGSHFAATRAGAQYCGNNCRNIAYRRRKAAS